MDREATPRSRPCCEDVIGDLLPVRVGNYDPFSPDPGDDGFCGNFFFGLTWQLYRFIGNDGFLYWVYDDPRDDAPLMRYLCDDKLALFQVHGAGGAARAQHRHADGRAARVRVLSRVFPGRTTRGP